MRARVAASLACAGAGLLGLVAAMLVSQRGGSTPAAGLLGVAALLSSGGIGLFALAGAFALREPVAHTLGLGAGRLRAPTLALLAVGTVGLSHLLDLASRWLDVRDQSILGWLDDVLRDAEGGAFLLALLGVGVAAGVAEELLFRGFALRTISARAGPAVAVALSATLFGAVHLDAVQSPAAALLGIYLGSVAVISGSTRAPILCHIANNLAALGALAWAPTATGEPSVWVTLAATAVSACALIALFREARRHAKTTLGLDRRRPGRTD